MLLALYLQTGKQAEENCLPGSRNRFTEELGFEKGLPQPKAPTSHCGF